MIKSLELINVQSHKNSVFEFDKGFNAIVGSSNKGKSVVMRALNVGAGNSNTNLASHWILTPKGDIKAKEETRVTIKSDRGAVSRVRAKGINGFEVDGDMYKAIGRDVPEEVKDVMNLSEVNTQGQMDAPFLLSYTSGEVAKFFNKILDLQSIDWSLSFVESERRATNAKIKAKQEDILAKEEKLEELAWVDKVEPLIKTLERLDRKRSLIKDEYEAINEHIRVVSALQKKIQKQARLVDAEAALTRAQRCDKNLKNIRKAYSGISKAISTAKGNQEAISIYTTLRPAESAINRAKSIRDKQLSMVSEIKELQGIVRIIKDIEYSRPYYSLSGAESAIGKVQTLKKNLETVKKDAKSLNKYYINITQLQRDLEEKHEIISELSNKVPAVCPTCGQVIKGD